MSNFHTPVLLQETISFLQIEKGKKYIDATIGGGGHAWEILNRGGKVLGIDVDEEALEYIERRTKNLELENGQLTLVRSNFRKIKEIAHLHNFEGVAGILFDLGVSSFQLDTATRGFSFQKEGPLDMRMDKDLGVEASDLVNILTKGELYELYSKLGEERYAFALAAATVRARTLAPITTTGQLTKVIETVIKKRIGISPATKVFQALRIAVNDELNNLRQALPQAVELLSKRGNLVVISFHSLEDRIVKHVFKEWELQEMGKILTPKPIVPMEDEIAKNIRARSAKLRVFQKRI